MYSAVVALIAASLDDLVLPIAKIVEAAIAKLHDAEHRALKCPSCIAKAPDYGTSKHRNPKYSLVTENFAKSCPMVQVRFDKHDRSPQSDIPKKTKRAI